jgi:hypothetical protein
MVTKEERVVFETELDKLNREYRKCGNRSLKLQIEKDICLIRSAISVIQEQKI